jgi:hypothetical protein
MRQIKTILLSLVLLLGVACSSTTTEPAAPAAPAVDEAAPVEEPAAAPAEESVTISEAGNELAAKPQFIMFTASW